MKVAVVGAGIVGLATAYELVRRGAAVTVYERGAPGGGQSGGESRIFRHVHDDPRLVALAVESLARWREWEARLGVELVAPVGVVAVGPAVERRFELLREAGVRARMTDTRVLPILAAGPVLLDEDGGVIWTTAAVRALVAALGDAIVADEVIEVSPSGEVRAGGFIASYDRVIVCAGRDTAALAGGLDLPVRVWTHTRHAYPVREPGLVACLLDGDHGAYGDPLPGGARYAIGRGDTDPSGYVAARLPGLEPRAVETRTCWVTELPWGDDAFAVWESGALRFLAGSNLFKHAPSIGHRLAADDLSELSPDARLGTN